MAKEQIQIDQFLKLITEYSSAKLSSAEQWKLKYISEIDENDVQDFDTNNIDYLIKYCLKNSLLYSDLISNTILSTDDILLINSCDKYFEFMLSFNIYGCLQNKNIEFIGEINNYGDQNQFSALYNIINQNKSRYSDFLLVPTSRFTAAFFREKVLYNHMYHGNKKLSDLLNKNSFYDYILGWDGWDTNYAIYKVRGDRFEEKVAAAKLSSKKLIKSGTLSQITDFILLSSNTNHDNLDDTETINKKKKKNNKLLKYMILSQFMNKN